MRVCGIVLVVVGVLGGLCSLAMDTTVSSPDGSRVHNLGLLAQQQAIMAFSAASFLGGVILLGLASLYAAVDERLSAQRTADRRPVVASPPVAARRPASGGANAPEDADAQAMDWIGPPPPPK